MLFWRILPVIFILVFGVLPKEAASAERLIIYSAASMKEAVEEIAGSFEKTCNCKTVLSVGGTGMLARQVVQGAPADIFISADEKWIEYLSDEQAIDSGSIQIIATNRLVIAVAKSQAVTENPLMLLDEHRFAIADPISVPAGRYAKEALKNLSEWEEFRPNAVQTENVRIALAMAARGDVTAAIVYASDLLVELRVKEAFRFASGLHSKIQYFAAQTSQAKGGGDEFLEFLKSPTARSILQKYGFGAVTDKD